MKRCPSCEKTYDDNALSFCPADGTRLVGERSSTPDLLATIMAPPPSIPAPMSFGPDSIPGYETTPPPSADFQTTTPPVETPSWESLQGAAPEQRPPAGEVKRPKPLTAYIIIGASVLIAGFLLLIWLVGMVAGIGGSLIHLLLVLALPLGFIGLCVGGFLLIMNRR